MLLTIAKHEFGFSSAQISFILHDLFLLVDMDDELLELKLELADDLNPGNEDVAVAIPSHWKKKN